MNVLKSQIILLLFPLIFSIAQALQFFNLLIISRR